MIATEGQLGYGLMADNNRADGWMATYVHKDIRVSVYASACMSV